MYAAAVRIELRIPGVRSLKEKRGRIKRLQRLLTDKYGCAVSEVGHHDQWQRTSLGLALVAPQQGHLDRVIHSVRRALDADPEIELLDLFVSHLERP